MRLNDLFEARRNPEVNTDGRLNDRMSSAFGFLSQFKPITGDLPTYFVTFTELPKVGINPRSKYQTPLGIYTYPIVPEIVMGHSQKTLPFAGEENYISVVQSAVHDDAILWFDDNGSYSNYDRDYAKLLDFIENGYGYGGQDTKGFLADAAHNAYDPRDQQSVIWNQTRWVAAMEAINDASHGDKGLSEVTEMLENVNDIPKIAIYWNYVLRKVLGYSAVVDMNSGTIHENEPLQAVFLTMDAIKLVDQRRNQNAANRGPKHMTMMELFRAAEGHDVEWSTFWGVLNKVLFPSQQRAIFRISKLNKVQHFIDKPVGMELDLVMTRVAQRHMSKTEAATFKVNLRVIMEKPLFKVADSTRIALLQQLIRGIIDYAPIRSEEHEIDDLKGAMRDTFEKFPFTEREIKSALQSLGLADYL